MSMTLGTLLVQMVSFMIFIWFTMIFVWKPLTGVMDQRNKQIADGLAAAEKGQKAEIEAKQLAASEIAAAKAQAAEIINKAEKRGSEIIEEAKAEAKVEAGRLLTGANAEIEQEFNRAREKLRSQIASIVVQGAQKVLEKEISEKAHSDLFNKLVSEI